jgi:hypothetical protein
MVRREEQPWQNRGVLLLDSRVTAHRGEGPGSSFEWAVSAIASIGSHLARDGFGLRFTTESGSEVSGYSADAMAGTPFEAVLLDSLALVSMSNAHSLTAGLAGIRRGGGGGLVIAALGSLTDADLDALTRFRHHASACVAIMLDTTSWAQATVPGQPVVRQRDHAQSCALLAGAGWRVVSVNARTDMRTMWGSAATNSQVLASR